MRRIVFSILFAVGVGLAGTGVASAAPVAGYPIPAATPVVEQVQYYTYHRRHRWHRWHRPFCRTERVCRRGPYGRRCWVRRVCR